MLSWRVWERFFFFFSFFPTPSDFSSFSLFSLFLLFFLSVYIQLKCINRLWDLSIRKYKKKKKILFVSVGVLSGKISSFIGLSYPRFRFLRFQLFAISARNKRPQRILRLIIKIKINI